LTDASRREYKAMFDDDLEWKLKSGRKVENILYKYGMQCEELFNAQISRMI